MSSYQAQDSNISKRSRVHNTANNGNSDFFDVDSKEVLQVESSKAETHKDEDSKEYVPDPVFNDESRGGEVLDRSSMPLKPTNKSVIQRGFTFGDWLKRTNCFNFQRQNMKFNGTPIDVIIETEQDPIKTVFVNIKKGGFRGFCAFILINRFYSILRVVFILFTSVTLGLNRYPQSTSETSFQRISHIISTVFFVIENFLLIVGGGYVNFFKDPFYVIDIIINFVSSP